MKGRYCQIVTNPDAISTLGKAEIESLLVEVGKTLEQEPKLLPLSLGRAIFVGDTHGDFQASKAVIASYLTKDTTNKIVFLGDYVDRGAQSWENINYLLLLKLLYPQNLFLLMGNHEAHNIVSFYPADFWRQLDSELYSDYVTVFTRLPLAVSGSNGVLALHGALPDVESLEGVNQINVGDEAWWQITWGDWQEKSGSFLGEDVSTGRPQFGKDYFTELMDRFEKNILIRSHQPSSPPAIYNRRCLTIFTSAAYVTARTIAIVDLSEEVKTIDDVIIESV